MNVPVIATNDVHYLEKGHHTSHDVLLCIQSGKNVSDQNRMKYNTTELYLKDIDEMYKAFPGKSLTPCFQCILQIRGNCPKKKLQCYSRTYVRRQVFGHVSFTAKPTASRDGQAPAIPDSRLSTAAEPLSRQSLPFYAQLLAIRRRSP